MRLPLDRCLKGLFTVLAAVLLCLSAVGQEKRKMQLTDSSTMEWLSRQMQLLRDRERRICRRTRSDWTMTTSR
jgi:hypothetical protein